MTEIDRLLELEIAIRGESGAPFAEMKVIGEFDRLQVVRFDKTIKALPRAMTTLTIDLASTTIIDSAALGSLIRLKRGLDGFGCRLDVVVGRPFQVVLMRIGGLYEFLNVREVAADSPEQTL